jgi:hypothetical protein
MHFKHPEILYFLFLLIVPILVHLFQFRRFKKEYFTNVRFLKSLSIQTRNSSKIKKWLLLACRLLLITLLVLAFAQPYFDAKDTTNKTNEMYIVLDNSFSMQAKGKKGELLKRAVQELLEQTPENATFSLLTNSDQYWDTDIKSIRNTLQNIKYSATPFQLDNIVSQIKNHKSAFKKDIIIISDAIGIGSKDLKNFDANNTPYFIIPTAEQKNNTSIDSVYINETLDNFYDISVELSHHGDDFKPVSVAIYNQNKLIAKTAANFETSKKTLNFTIPKRDFHGYVSIIDNGLSYDNTLYFSIANPSQTTVLSIGETEKSSFLSRIYTNDEFNYRNSEIKSLDYNAIEKQNTVVLNELEEIPQALQITLKSFVEKGGNLIVIPSEKTTIQNINPFLSNFGTIQFKPLQKTEKLITKINFNHPLFGGVFEDKITNFQYPKTKSSFIISGSAPVALYNQDQTAFLSSSSNGVADVYLFSAPINTLNSNFQLSPLIVPTFYKMATSNKKSAVNAFTIGNKNTSLVDVSLTKDAILTVKNDAEQFIPIQQILNNKVKLIFNDYPEEAGNFKIYSQKEFIENISFNYNRTESNLAEIDENVLAEYEIIPSVASVFDSLQTNRTDHQIWKWFVIFALLFLTTEIAIIRFLK